MTTKTKKRTRKKVLWAISEDDQVYLTRTKKDSLVIRDEHYSNWYRLLMGPWDSVCGEGFETVMGFLPPHSEPVKLTVEFQA